MALVDEADPAWHRRGMAFTNAWYLGNAELDGEGACFCASLKSMPSILARRMIAATTWSWQGIAAAFATTVLIDARRFKRRGEALLRGRVPITIGIGAERAELERSSTIEADRHGRFMTERRIGDTVRTGEIVGGIGTDAVKAPCLRRLAGPRGPRRAHRAGRHAGGSRLRQGEPCLLWDFRGREAHCAARAGRMRDPAGPVIAL